MENYNHGEDPFEGKIDDLSYAVLIGLRRISNAKDCTAVESAARDARNVIRKFRGDPFYRFIRRTPRYSQAANNLSEQVERSRKSRERELIGRLRNREW